MMFKLLYFKKEILEGVKKSLLLIPMMLSVTFSYTIISGALGLNSIQTVLWSGLMFAGTVQIAVLNAYAAGASIVESILVAIMTGLRLGFVSISIFPYIRNGSKRIIPYLSFFIVDPAAGIVPTKAKEKNKDNIIVFTFAFLLFTWLQWIFYTWIVVIIGPFIPSVWNDFLAFAAPAFFVAIVILMIQNDFPNGIIIIIIVIPLSLSLTFFLTPQMSSIIASIVTAYIAVIIEERGKAKFD